MMNWEKKRFGTKEVRFLLYLSHQGKYFIKDSTDAIKKNQATQSHTLLEVCINSFASAHLQSPPGNEKKNLTPYEKVASLLNSRGVNSPR